MISPRDSASGLPTGRRQHQPITIVKQWGAASPQGLTACATNEVLAEVAIEFIKMTPNANETVYQTVKLTDASISQIARVTGHADGSEDTPTSGHSGPSNMLDYERGPSRSAGSRSTTTTAIRRLRTRSLRAL